MPPIEQGSADDNHQIPEHSPHPLHLSFAYEVIFPIHSIQNFKNGTNIIGNLDLNEVILSRAICAALLTTLTSI